jgi:hypothetical protein
MAHWAEVSITEQFSTVPFGDEDMTGDEVGQVEVKCPMCRTLTKTSPNGERERELRGRYPDQYRERAKEEAEGEQDGEVVRIDLYVGNHHELVDSRDDNHNKHDWTFFVRPSRTDVIEEVIIKLVSF